MTSDLVKLVSSEVLGHKPELKAASLSTIVAPTSSYALSKNCAPAPAPVSTLTLIPFLMRAAEAAGLSATLFSVPSVSAGTPEQGQQGQYRSFEQ